MANLFHAIEKNAESVTGLSINAIRWFSPSELRVYFEEKKQKKLTFTSEFPFIGRGNVLRDRVVMSDAINSEVDKILGKI